MRMTGGEALKFPRNSLSGVAGFVSRGFSWHWRFRSVCRTLCRTLCRAMRRTVCRTGAAGGHIQKEGAGNTIGLHGRLRRRRRSTCVCVFVRLLKMTSMWERWTVQALWLCFYYYSFCLYYYYFHYARCGFTANRKELTSCPEHPYCTSQQHAPPLTDKDKDMKDTNTNTNNFRSSSEHKHYTSWTADNSHQMRSSSHFQSLPWFSLVITRS